MFNVQLVNNILHIITKEINEIKTTMNPNHKSLLLKQHKIHDIQCHTINNYYDTHTFSMSENESHQLLGYSFNLFQEYTLNRCIAENINNGNQYFIYIRSDIKTLFMINTQLFQLSNC